MEALRLERISKDFGSLSVLRDVSFSINDTERIVSIIGPNGAGKTTLFNVISGEYSPKRGKVYFFSKDITKMRRYRRPHLGLSRTFQITDLFPNFTVNENIVLALQARERFRYQMLRAITGYTHLYEKADALLEKVNLLHKKSVTLSGLSHGEMRLVELLLGFALQPTVLLLDEPLAGLTSSESEWIAGLIKDLSKNVIVILIEHDIKIAFMLAERVLVLHQGVIIADGPPEAIKENKKVRQIYLGREVGE